MVIQNLKTVYKIKILMKNVRNLGTSKTFSHQISIIYILGPIKSKDELRFLISTLPKNYGFLKISIGEHWIDIGNDEDLSIAYRWIDIGNEEDLCLAEMLLIDKWQSSLCAHEGFEIHTSNTINNLILLSYCLRTIFFSRDKEAVFWWLYCSYRSLCHIPVPSSDMCHLPPYVGYNS
jgi:hypothetical protein